MQKDALLCNPTLSQSHIRAETQGQGCDLLPPCPPQGHMLLQSPIPSLQQPPKQFLGQTVIGNAVNSSSQKLSPSQPQQQLAG